MSNDITIVPPLIESWTFKLSQYRCDVHGEHSAMVHIRAVSDQRIETRRYCMFCVIDFLDAMGLKEMTPDSIAQEGKP